MNRDHREHVKGASQIILSLANKGDSDELTDLVGAAYRKSADFEVHSESYFSDHFVGNCAVLIARSNGKIIATMRGSLLKSTSDLGGEDEGGLSPDMMPGIYLSRSVTAPEWRRVSLNSLLRLHILDAALEMNLQSAASFVYENAPRVRTMSNLGYTFVKIQSRGNEVRTYKTQCLFAKIDLKRDGHSAKTLLRKEVAALIPIVKWVGPSVLDTFNAGYSQR